MQRDPISCGHPVRNPEQLYELLVQELQDYAVFLLDPSGCIASWNEGVEKILQYREEEFLGHPCALIFTPEDRARGEHEKEIATAKRDGRALDERWHMRKDGSFFFCHGVLTAIYEGDTLLGYSKVLRDVTPQHEAERQREAMLAERTAMLEAAGEGIVGLDTDGRCTFLNQAATRLLGLTVEECLGKTMDDLCTWQRPESSADLHDTNPIRRAYARGENVRVEEDVICRSDGSYVWVTYTAAPVLVQGKLTGAIVTFRDVSGHRAALERLRESERRLQGILDSTSLVVYLKDLDGRFVVVNRRFEELFQVRREEIVDKTDFDLFPADLAQRFQENDHRVIEEGVPLQLEEDAPHPDGLHTYISVKFPLLNDAGETYAVCGISADITERKKAEQALREAEGTIRALFENAAQAILATEADGRIHQVNSAAENTLGYPRAELIGKPLDHVLPAQFCRLPDDLPEQHHQGMPVDVQAVRRDGTELPVEARLSYVSTQRGMMTVAFLQDISERKRIEAERERLMLELERSNAELSQFSHVVSHDLQAPLRTVKSYVQLLSRRYRDQLDDNADEFISYIVQGVEGMETLIRALLRYAQAGQGRMQKSPVRAGAVLDAVMVNLHQQIVETGAVIEREPLPAVEADPVQLLQVFQNLIGNAIKYGGTATPHIHVGARIEGEEWLFSVSDNGIGIPEKQLTRIFLPLTRLHGKEVPGTGIGLAVCKRIVEHHGGRIWAESGPEGGATFLFTLPRTSISVGD